MTIIEFKEKLDRIHNHSKDLVVTVLTEGMSGSQVKVTGMSEGFDWYDGALLLTTELPVTTYGLKNVMKLKRLYLDQVSKIKYNIDTKQWDANFKKQKQQFEMEYQAILWISEQMDIELERKRI